MVTNGFVAKAFYSHITKHNQMKIKDVDRNFLYSDGSFPNIPETRNDKKLEVIDTGGQRGDQTRYVHLFKNITCVLFVAAINEYDQYYEEDNRSRLDVSVELFRETLEEKTFQDSAMIVFLNKNDLFRKKLTTAPFKSYGVTMYTDYELGDDDAEPYAQPLVEQRNLDYKGKECKMIKFPPYKLDGSDEEFEQCYNDTCDYIRELYRKQSDDLPFKKSRNLYIHFTTSTDTKNLERIMESAQDVILNTSLTDLGAII